MTGAAMNIVAYSNYFSDDQIGFYQQFAPRRVPTPQNEEPSPKEVLNSIKDIENGWLDGVLSGIIVTLP